MFANDSLIYMATATPSTRRRRRQNTVTNHIGNAVTVGAVAYGVYWIGRTVWERYFENADSTSTPLPPADANAPPTLSTTQLQLRLQTCQQDALHLYKHSLAPSIRSRIVQATPLSAARNRLQLLRQQQDVDNTELRSAWIDVCVETWTRLVADWYCRYVLVFVLSWVHSHRVAHSVVHDNNNNNPLPTWQPPPLEGVVERMRPVVRQILESSSDVWDCFHPDLALCMTHPVVRDTWVRITRSCYAASRWVVTTMENFTADPVLLDLWESPMVDRALHDCWQRALLPLPDLLFPPPSTPRPVATIVAELKQLSARNNNNNELDVAVLAVLPSVQELGKLVLTEGCRLVEK